MMFGQVGLAGTNGRPPRHIRIDNLLILLVFLKRRGSPTLSAIGYTFL